MRIKQKLVVAFASIALLVAVAGYLRLRFVGNISETFEDLKSDIVPGAHAMGRMESASNQIAHDLMDYMIAAGEVEEVEEVEVKSGLKLLIKAGQEHLEHEKHIGDEEKNEAKGLLAKIDRFAWAATEIINLKKQGAAIDELSKKEDEILHPALHSLTEQLAGHKAVHMIELAEAAASVSQAQWDVYKTILISSIVILVIAISIGLFLSRTICSPLIELKAAAAEIGKGNLNFRIEIKSKDELGQLAACFNTMAEDLRKTTTSMEKFDAANQQLQASEEKLRKKMEQLERFNHLMIGREMRMSELKGEVNALLAELGREEEYRTNEGIAETCIAESGEKV